MERSWWWKAVLYGAVTLLACLYLVPTVVPEEKQPAFFKTHFTKRIQKGLDLQGGLHLVYAVDIDKAVSAKVDHLANEIEDAIKKKTPDVTVVHEGRDDILVTFKNPADNVKLDQEILRPRRAELDEVSRDKDKGQVRLRLDSNQVAEIEDLALRQGIETIRGRVDKLGVSEPTIIKKGTDIIVELPGLKPADFERIKSIIGRTAQLEFKIVDDGSEYMKRVAVEAKKLPASAGIEVLPDEWTEKDNGKAHEDVFLRSKSREALTKFFAELPPELAVPADREIGYEELQGRGSDGELSPDRYWRTYLLHRRAGLTGE